MKIEVTIETKNIYTFEVDLNEHLAIDEGPIGPIEPKHVLEYAEHIQDLKENTRQWLEEYKNDVHVDEEIITTKITPIV